MNFVCQGTLALSLRTQTQGGAAPSCYSAQRYASEREARPDQPGVPANTRVFRLIQGCHRKLLHKLTFASIGHSFSNPVERSRASERKAIQFS